MDLIHRLASLAAVVCAPLLSAPAVSPLAELGSTLPASPGIVLTQARAGAQPQLMFLDWQGRLRPLAPGFFASADADVSFDAKRVVFAGRKIAAEPWQIYELQVAGGEPRRITQSAADCRQPVYQSPVFSLDIPLPWYQVAYVSGGSIHSIKLDGTLNQQLTFTPSRDSDPLVLPDGRMIYSSRTGNRAQLMGVNLDGTDYALFLPGSNLHSPAVLGTGEVVFVEGAGTLSAVSLHRPLGARRLIPAGPGAYSTPAALPNGEMMASWKQAAGGTSALYRIHPATGKRALLFVSPGAEITQARMLAPREEPAGRGSVVDEAARWARLYCLSVFTTDAPAAIHAKSTRRIRVIAGPPGSPRTLGEADLEADGSFHLEIPPNVPLKLQLLSVSGAVLRTSAWIYARNKENRGCIGCHEDPELSPENRETLAIIKKPVSLIPAAHSGTGDHK